METMNDGALFAKCLIDALGGTAAVAALCEIRAPSVSGWKKKGVPQARLMYLRAIRPEECKAAERCERQLRREASSTATAPEPVSP